MKKVFDLLKKEGLTNNEKIERKVMYEWSPNEIIDFNEKLLDAIEPQPKANSNIANFNYVANSNLSAQRFGNSCVGLNCRLQRIDRLTRFAALYSDRIYIQNYFDIYPNRPLPPHMSIKWIDDNLREPFADDLKVLLALKPLLENSIVCFVKHPAFHFCPSCMRKYLPVLTETQTELKNKTQALSDNYLDSTSARIALWFQIPGECCIDLKGPEDLFAHGQIYDVRSDPWLLKKANSAHGRISARDIKLSKKELKRTGIIERGLKEVADDILFQHFCSRFVSAKYLTDRDVDVQLLDSLTYDDDFKAYNEVLRNRIIYNLPLLDSVPLNYLLEVRRKEHDAFLVYRNTISHIISEYLAQRKPISSREGQQIYEDIIYPKLCELNAKVNSIKSSAMRAFKRDIAITSTVAILGMYSGLLPIETQAIVAGLGGLKAARDALQLLSRSITTPDEIRSDNFYFLWKLSKKQGGAHR